MSEARHALPSSRWRIAAFAAVIVVVGGGIAFFLLKNHGGSTTPGSITTTGSPSPKTPKFDFKLLGAKAIRSSDSTKAADLKQTADQSAQDIARTLDRMYSLAFLDPSNWQHGTYSNVYGFFDLGKAQKIAARDTALLTLGTGAGDQFSTVLPSAGTLKVRVLMDPSGNAYTAVAIAHFAARATDKSGTGETTVVSTAQYFMHILEGGWTIYGYRVERNDHPVKSKVHTPSPTAAPSASAT
ncbi:MAG: hypothetical protein M3Q23_04500 [Actinomycetota bacterium]|nr:hypothetical protein [Actinomycetota bacterium]